MTELADSELLEMFRHSGNPDYAFNLLVKKYQEKVYWHVRRLVMDHDDANDITQDVFIKAWKGLENFRADSGLFTWLYRIATNETITFLNKKKKRFFIPWHDIEKVLGDKLESDRYFKADEIQKKLQKAILTLPEKQRIVFNLRYYDEMKYEEMSEILDTSVGALKASYHHAVKKVEEHLKNH
jgi:RNA polymerase sigma factor (sigma-70 family)